MSFQTIAQGLADNRRLATFHVEKSAEFLEYLKTRYDSEIDMWMQDCKKSDWKYSFLVREREIRKKQRRIDALKELAKVW